MRTSTHSRSLSIDGSPADDRTLAAQALAGDASAFEQLVERYLDRTFQIAFRMIGNREDAEDVAQETFARAHRHLAKFQGRSAFGTWITSICIHLCLDHERRRKRTPAMLPLEAPLQLDGALQQPDGPVRRVVRRETAHRMERAVGKLPRRLRSALVLRVFQGQDYETVAETLGTTIRSARIYVSEARKRLADQMRADLAGGDP